MGEIKEHEDLTPFDPEEADRKARAKKDLTPFEPEKTPEEAPKDKVERNRVRRNRAEE